MGMRGEASRTGDLDRELYTGVWRTADVTGEDGCEQLLAQVDLRPAELEPAPSGVAVPVGGHVGHGAAVVVGDVSLS